MNKILHHHHSHAQVNLPEHFTRIFRLLAWVLPLSKPDIHVEHEYSSVAEPLRIAASIRQIETMSDLFDNSYMCQNALEFEFSLSELTSLYIRETTRFIWAWIAFEELIKIIGMKKNKWERITMFLMSGESFVPVGLAHNFQQGIMLAKKTDANIVEKFSAHMQNKSKAPFPYIHFCRIARNCFLHSSQVNLSDFDFTGPSEKDFLNNDNIAFMETLTRLILLAIQHILAVYYKDSKCMADLDLSADEDEALFSLSSILLVLHLKNQQGARQICSYYSQESH